MDVEAYLQHSLFRLKTGEKKLKAAVPRIKMGKDVLWTIVNCALVLGVTIGALLSKLLSNKLDKISLVIISNQILIITSIFVYLTFEFAHFALLVACRLFCGIQGGIALMSAPEILQQILPTHSRCSASAIHQLAIAVGILLAQLLGFRSVMGNESGWRILLCVPVFKNSLPHSY